jgi:hypothetical protein
VKHSSRKFATASNAQATAKIRHLAHIHSLRQEYAVQKVRIHREFIVTCQY